MFKGLNGRGLMFKGTWAVVDGIFADTLKGRQLSAELFFLPISCIPVRLFLLKGGKDTFAAGTEVIVNEGCCVWDFALLSKVEVHAITDAHGKFIVDITLGSVVAHGNTLTLNLSGLTVIVGIVDIEGVCTDEYDEKDIPAFERAIKGNCLFFKSGTASCSDRG